MDGASAVRGQQEALRQWMQQQQDAAAFAARQSSSTAPPQFPASANGGGGEMSAQDLLTTLQMYSSSTNAPPSSSQLVYAAFPTGTAPLSMSMNQPSSLVQHDSNSYEDSFPLGDGYSYGTPSYAGSWSDHPSPWGSIASQHHPPPAGDPFGGGEGSGSSSAYYLQQQQQQGVNNPFLLYRDPFGGSQLGQDDEAGSTYGGSNASHGGPPSNYGGGGGAGSSAAGSQVGAVDDLGSMIDFDFEPMGLGGRSPSPFAPVEVQQEGSGVGGEEEEDTRYRQGHSGTFIAPSQQQGALPLVFTSTLLADSPPVTSSASEFPSTTSTRTTSPPSLAPLAIPSDGPSFNLIQPTPHTARPKDRQKGAGTLELESILGMGDWATKHDQDSSFSDFTPHRPSSSSSNAAPNRPSTSEQQDDNDDESPRPLLSSQFSSPPETFEHSTPAAATAAPENLAVPSSRRGLSRRRSRSEPDITSPQFAFPPPAAAAPNHSHSPSHSPAPAPPLSLGEGGGFDYLHQHQQHFPDLSNHPPPPQNHPFYASSPPLHDSSLNSAATTANGNMTPLDIHSWSALMTQQQQALAYHQYNAAVAMQAAAGAGAGGADLAEEVRIHQQLMQQHELASASGATRSSRSSFGAQQGGRGGPGYHEAGGMFGEERGSHRRSRSHGGQGGHVRGVQSEDYAGQQWMYGSSAPPPPGDRLAPPLNHRSPSIPPSTHSHHSRSPSPSLSYTSSNSPQPPNPRRSPSFPSFPDPSVLLNTSLPDSIPPPPAHRSSSFTQHLSLGHAPPYIYHSPVASPQPGASASPEGSAYEGSVGGGSWGPGSGAQQTTTTAGAGGKRAAVSRESKTTPATIEAAMRRRNPGTAAKFACDLCGETFTRRYNLKGHQRAHRNEKPFACSYEGCGKAFARAHDCKRHELLHLNVRRYHCEPCHRDFIRLDALQRHHRSDVGQACVEQLRAQGYEIGYDVSSADAGVQL